MGLGITNITEEEKNKYFREANEDLEALGINLKVSDSFGFTSSSIFVYLSVKEKGNKKIIEKLRQNGWYYLGKNYVGERILNFDKSYKRRYIENDNETKSKV